MTTIDNKIGGIIMCQGLTTFNAESVIASLNITKYQLNNLDQGYKKLKYDSNKIKRKYIQNDK